jgi:hypothetical protein
MSKSNKKNLFDLFDRGLQNGVERFWRGEITLFKKIFLFGDKSVLRFPLKQKNASINQLMNALDYL